ncbi:MAG: phosphate ABC transporter permease PstA [Candidatus Rariloculaceae bacterium]
MNNSSTEGSLRDRVSKGLARRYRRERYFRLIGFGALSVGLLFLGFFFYTIISNGHSAFQQTNIRLDLDFRTLGIEPDVELTDDVLASANYLGLVRDSLRQAFPDVSSRAELRELFALASSGGAFELRDLIVADPSILGTEASVWLLADDDVDMLIKGHFGRDWPAQERRISDNQLAWIESLEADNRLELQFNRRFFVSGDSRDPELAGVWSATVGSFFMLLVTLALSFPLGVGTAIYLEEFAPRNRWTDLIEVNINNLAAVPSIVFGLLGLALFINLFGLPRSAPLVGGLVLTLMTLPVIIIAARASLAAVPPSIREAALGVGASKMQTVVHHVLPLAMPGMLTGTIIGMARALGESAPLLMIGMVAFIVDVPNSPLDPSTALPVQVYLWADSPERAFVERTSAAILVLLMFLLLMNSAAILLRRYFERRW